MKSKRMTLLATLMTTLLGCSTPTVLEKHSVGTLQVRQTPRPSAMEIHLRGEYLHSALLPYKIRTLQEGDTLQILVYLGLVGMVEHLYANSNTLAIFTVPDDINQIVFGKDKWVIWTRNETKDADCYQLSFYNGVYVKEPCDFEEKSKMLNETLLRDVGALLSLAEKKMEAQNWVEANDLLKQGLAVLGFSYWTPEVVDDSGMRLILADQAEQEEKLELAAKFRRTVLKGRYQMLEEQKRFTISRPKGDWVFTFRTLAAIRQKLLEALKQKQPPQDYAHLVTAIESGENAIFITEDGAHIGGWQLVYHDHGDGDERLQLEYTVMRPPAFRLIYTASLEWLDGEWQVSSIHIVTVHRRGY
jgi:hypothetical protein